MPPPDLRVGIGFDVHPLKVSRKFYLGGILVSEEIGPEGHSDADPLSHAIADAILGASGSPDIGHIFPDKEEEFHNLPGPDLLQKIARRVHHLGWDILNVDAVLWLEEPGISGKEQAIRQSIAQSLGIELQKVNLKAKRGEGLGFVGEKEGVASFATALLEKRQKERQREEEAEIFIDGGSKGNPGIAASAAVFKIQGKIKFIFGEKLALATNNQAEYHALLMALEEALRKGIKKVVIASDSELLVRQMKGEFEVKDPILGLRAQEARELIEEFQSIHFRLIKREENRFADKLVNFLLES